MCALRRMRAAAPGRSGRTSSPPSSGRYFATSDPAAVGLSAELSPARRAGDSSPAAPARRRGAVARHGRRPYAGRSVGANRRMRRRWRSTPSSRHLFETKPIVSSRPMMLFEEAASWLGRAGREVPARTRRARGSCPSAPAPRRASRRSATLTIQDLLRHTSGLTYENTAADRGRRLYVEARTNRRDQTSAELVTRLGGLPLQHHPGTVWEYSRSTDVLGRLVEVISGQTLRRLPRRAASWRRSAWPIPAFTCRERAAPPRRRLCGRSRRRAPVNYLDVRRKAGPRIGRRRPRLDDRRLCPLSSS